VSTAWPPGADGLSGKEARRRLAEFGPNDANLYERGGLIPSRCRAEADAGGERRGMIWEESGPGKRTLIPGPRVLCLGKPKVDGLSEDLVTKLPEADAKAPASALIR
jgi:hypothetical protein